MDFFWRSIESAFAQLPDYLKLVLFSTLMVAAIWFYARRALAVREAKRLQAELTEVRAKRDQRIRELQDDFADRLERIRDERDQLQKRLDALDQVDDHIWTRPVQVQDRGAWPRDARSLRFLAVCNLKGGVGKTTLTLNLGAALGQMGKRTLLVDLDFQGSLSNFLVPGDLIADYRRKGWTTDRLLLPDVLPESIREIVFEAADIPNVSGMIAKETLELTEYAQQAKFFVDPSCDPRFRICRRLHCDGVLQAWDVVLFDCPPRMTAGCVNALAAADYVLIPTTLSELDIEAVRRTLRWLRELHHVVKAELLGVVVSRCKIISGKLTIFDQGQLGNLDAVLARELIGRGYLCEAKIPEMPDIHKATASRRPAVLQSPACREWFTRLAHELVGRMHS